MNNFERLREMDNETLTNLRFALDQFNCMSIHCGACPMNYADPTHYPEVFESLPEGYNGCLVSDVRTECNKRGI